MKSCHLQSRFSMNKYLSVSKEKKDIAMYKCDATKEKHGGIKDQCSD